MPIGDQALKVILEAEDRMTPVMNAARASLNQWGKAADGLAPKAGIFDKLAAATGGLITPSKLAFAGLGLLAGAIGLAVSKAVEGEASMARLRTALNANVTGWDGNTDAIERTIRAGQRLGFQGTEQETVLARLVTATKNVAAAQNLLTIAYDLARAKNISLDAAASQLIQVWGGQYRSLRNLGINIKSTTSATTALEEVQRRVAGAGLDYAKTIQGRSEALAASVDSLFETIGRYALPVLSEVATEAEEAAAGLDELAGGSDRLDSILGRTTDTLIEFVKSGLNAGVLAQRLAANAKGLANEFNPLPHLLDRGAENLDDVAEAADEVRRSFSRAYDPTDALADAMNRITDSATDAADALAEAHYGPAILRGELAGLQLDARETEKEIRKLSKKKDLTKEDRLELQRLKGELASTRADIFVTSAKLQSLGEPLPNGLERSIGRVIGRMDMADDRVAAAIRKYRFWLGLTGETTTQRGATGKSTDKLQHGGPALAGRAYDVGEGGPERLIMFPGGGGFVFPNRGARSGGDGGPIEVPVTVQLDGEVIYRSVERRQRRDFRSTADTV